MLGSPGRSVTAMAASCVASAALIALAHLAAHAAPPVESLAGERDRSLARWLEARGLSSPHDSRPCFRSPEHRSAAPRLAADDRWDDSHWAPRFGLPVPDNGIHVLLPYGGLLIAGGYFQRVGNLETPGIAAWDGTIWSRVGDFPGSNVTELALHGTGFLALGSGDQGPALWRWNGAIWETFAPLPSWAGNAFDLAVEGDAVAVAVAEWDIDSDTWRSRVLLHQQGQWTPLGNSVTSLEALAWYGGELHAGGYIPEAGIVHAAVVRWNGSSWLAVGAEFSGPTLGWVRDLAAFDGELIVAGSFRDEGNPAMSRCFARWNGERWASFDEGGPQHPNLARLRVVAHDLYALGHLGSGLRPNGIARWDGGAWHLDEESLESFVFDVAPYEGRLHAGGYLARNGSRPATPLVRREAGRWLPPTVPSAAMHGLLGAGGPGVRSIVIGEDGVVAAGDFEFAGTAGEWRRTAQIARWDGSEWRTLGLETFADARVGQLAYHQGALHAVGSFHQDVGGSSSVLRLEDGTWRPLSDSFAPFLNAFRIASALGSLFVAGSRDDQYGGIARWDGSEWREMGGGMTQGAWVSAITEHAGEVIVAGNFQEIAGLPCRNIAAWNPATGWHALGEGLDDDATDLLSRDGVLYVSGTFSHVGGVASPGIARWRGGDWEAVPMPDDDPPHPLRDVSSLGWFGDQLVASGVSLPGGLAALDAEGRWHALGSGINGRAMSLVAQGSSLFVGGFFSRAGGSPAYGFAQWRDDVDPSTTFGRISVMPNPSTAVVRMRYELTLASRVRLEIFDLAGKRVHEPIEEFQSPGSRELVWEPGLDRVRPGVYFARLTAGATSLTTRVVRVR